MSSRSSSSIAVLFAVPFITLLSARTLADAPPVDAGASVRPNIVLFLVDDLGQQDVSVPMLADASALNARYHTPNLEKLAARGLHFSNAYAAAPVCTPSRTAIISGQSPARTHITYWTLDKDVDTSTPHPRLVQPKWEVHGLQPSPQLLPALLRSAGYATIHAGKSHLGARATEGADPLKMGYEINIAGHAAGAPGSYLGTQWFRDAARKRAEKADPAVPADPADPADPATAPASVWDVPGLEKWHGQDIWLDDAIARDACDAMTKAVASARPFFLSFCPYGVHTPLMEDARFAKDYAALDARERKYATMIAAVDDALGQIVARCAALGVLDRTVIIFTSDNGGLSAHSRGAAPDGTTAHNHNAPLRSGKGSGYDGGTRVALVAAGPGIPHRNSPIDAPVIGTDLYPTMLAFAGVEPPKDRVLDGVDLAPLLRGGAAPAERTLFWHQPHKWGPEGPGIEPFTAIRRGDWKLVWFHDAGLSGARIELYDIAHDAGETHDLAAADPARLSAMIAFLRETLDATSAQLPTVRATSMPVERP